VLTGERVKRMRIVGRSLTRFYQYELGLSIDNLAFNYIEMCTSRETSDILKLFIATLRVLLRNEEIVSELTEFMVSMEEDELGLFKIMIEYASRIGEKAVQESESPQKWQKRLVTKV
jgi:hypothetical protein